jgi:hypothetical protein
MQGNEANLDECGGSRHRSAMQYIIDSDLFPIFRSPFGEGATV